MTAVVEKIWQRNRWLLVIEYVLFGAALALLSPGIVLPELVQRLGGSPLLVGSLGAIQAGGWLLPQLIAGRMVANKPCVKKYVIWPIAVSRFGVLVMVPALALFGAHHPGVAIAVLLLGFATFNVGDALGSVAWTDLCDWPSV